MSQRQLGALIGKDRRTVLDTENGKRWPGGFTLLQMLQALGAVETEPDPADSPLAQLEEKVDEALGGIADILALLGHHADGAGAQEDSP